MSTTRSKIITRYRKLSRVAIYASMSRTAFHKCRTHSVTCVVLCSIPVFYRPLMPEISGFNWSISRHQTILILIRWTKRARLQCSSVSASRRLEASTNCNRAWWTFSAAMNNTLSTHLLTSVRDLMRAFALMKRCKVSMCRLFTALHALHAMRSSHELSVYPSVCPSVTAWIVTKRKKDLSRFLYHTKDHLA